MHRGPAENSALHAGFLGYHQLQRCLSGLVDLPCFILRQPHSGDAIEWWELLSDDRKLRPFDFEFRYGQAQVRDTYHSRNLDKLKKSGKPVVASLYGFSDLYAPLCSGGGGTLTFYAGQWSATSPSYEELRDAWYSLTGKQPQASDRDFRRWVRACLAVPVLSTAQLSGLQRVASTLAALNDQAPAKPKSVHTTQRTLEKLRKTVFAPNFEDHNWVQSALDLDGLTRPPWGLDDHPDPRLIEDLGLRLRPTMVALLSLSRKSASLHPLEHLVSGRLLQRGAVRLCRTLPNCLAAPLGDDAVIVALALPGSVRGPKRRSTFAKLTCELQSLLRASGLRTNAGLGEEVLPGEGLGASYRKAAAELAQDAQQQFSTPSGAGAVQSLGSIQSLSRRVIECLRASEVEQLASNGRLFSQALLAKSGAQTDAMRHSLAWVMAEALSRLNQDGVLSSGVATSLLGQFQADYQRLMNATALVEAYLSQLSHLGQLLTRAQTVDREARLERAVAWLLAHPESAAPLTEVAKRAGLAEGSFRRAFSQTYGQSFGQWWRTRRTEIAERLLSQSDLPIAVIARRVGFSNAASFGRSFTKRTGTSPGAFRRHALLASN